MVAGVLLLELCALSKQDVFRHVGRQAGRQVVRQACWQVGRHKGA